MGIFVYNVNLGLPNSIITKKSNNLSHHFTFHQLPSQFVPSLKVYKKKLKSTVKMEQNPSTKQEKITLQNKSNEKLVGLLQDTGSADIVVLCHGFRSSKESEVIMNLAAALENEGISSFRFDFSGNGESEGSFQYGHYKREADDLRSVVEYFTGTNRRIASILGHSKGGNVVLLYASKYHDIGGVVNLSGRYKLDRGIEERLGKEFLEKIKKDGYIDVKNGAGEVQYRVTEESLMDRLNTDMHKACLQIDKECRVFTVHGSGDEIIPVEDALEFSKIIPNHRLDIIEGADHCYSSHQDELHAVVVPIIKECLQKMNKESG